MKLVFQVAAGIILGGVALKYINDLSSLLLLILVIAVVIVVLNNISSIFNLAIDLIKPFIGFIVALFGMAMTAGVWFYFVENSSPWYLNLPVIASGAFVFLHSVIKFIENNDNNISEKLNSNNNDVNPVDKLDVFTLSCRFIAILIIGLFFIFEIYKT
jgi:hypothetical protein